MRRRLILLRHAKAAQAAPGNGDFDRPLNERGREAVPMIASAARAARLNPDRVLCSPARRTRETWDLVAQSLNRPVATAFPRGLYLADADRILAAVRRQPDDVRQLMVVGHNPGLGALAVALAGSGTADDLDRLRAKFPTAALAVIAFDTPRWREIGLGEGRLECFVRPKDRSQPPGDASAKRGESTVIARKNKSGQ